MQTHEAAERLGISARRLRHYEKAGLLEIARDANGYRRFSPSDLRRAGRIRDLIATGFSTREIQAMAPCLSDEGAGPCEAGLADLTHKLEQIDRLLEELQQRRASTLARIERFRDSLSPHPETESSGHESANDPAVSDRLSGRQ